MRRYFLQGIKAGLFAMVLSCIGVLILALFAQIFTFSDKVLVIANQIVKIAAVVFGVALFVRNEKLLPKAMLAAVVFWLSAQVLSCILGGTFNWGQFFLDLIVALVVAMLVAIVKSKKA